MTPFLLEGALSSAPVPSRSLNEFMTYILETQLPGVHFNVDDDVGLPKATVLSPQSFSSTGPRLGDSAREDHMIPEYQQSLEGWGSSDNAAMKTLAKGDPSTWGEEAVYFGEPDDVILGGIFHSQCLEFLCKKGPNILMGNLKDKETICSMLLKMADNVKVLPPADEPLPWDILNMSLWKASLCELIKEMKTVEEKCASLICNSGVYVLTTTPYAAFLRALTVEIADGKGSPGMLLRGTYDSP